MFKYKLIWSNRYIEAFYPLLSVFLFRRSIGVHFAPHVNMSKSRFQARLRDGLLATLYSIARFSSYALRLTSALILVFTLVLASQPPRFIPSYLSSIPHGIERHPSEYHRSQRCDVSSLFLIRSDYITIL